MRELLSSRSSVIRKGTALALRIPRRISSVLARNGPSPVLVNSVPKSGTHLLLQLVSGAPGLVHWGSFIASEPSLTLRRRRAEEEVQLLRRLVPGEISPAHLFWSEQVARAVQDLGIRHLFIYRDPRAVAVSEAHYLTHMNRWHRLHSLFARLPSEKERLRLSIAGQAGADVGFPNIRERMGKYLGWLGEPCLAVRYEDLRSDRQESEARRIAGYLFGWDQSTDECATTAREMLAMVEPGRSHTYRSGKVRGWVSVFDDELRSLFKEIAGELLIDLGYEQDLDW